MRRILAALAAATFVLTLSVSVAAAGGPPAVGFYVDDEPYRTIGTPTDFEGTGAPLHSFDVIYALGDGLTNVAESKPGDTDYNGGRWMVLEITWADGVMPEQLTSAEEVETYAAAGWLTIGTDPVRQFLCPVIKVPGNQ